MADQNKDLNHPILNLTTDEKRAYGNLFAQADKEQLGVVTGENAVAFFERTRVSPSILGEIWQIADTENRGLLTKPGFCIVLRLIGHYQAGRDPSPELAFKPAPIPKFDGGPAPGMPPGSPLAPSAIPPTALSPQLSGTPAIRVPALDPPKVQQFSALFERSATQNGLLDGVTAKAIFERAGLPNEVLGRIWNLSDREQKGALDQTEFIVAMHLLTSMKSRVMPALPATLPSALFEAAARRGVPAPNRALPGPGAIPRQITGNSVGPGPRTQSPLAKPPAAFPAPVSAVTTGTWLVTPADKAKFDQFFSMIDTQGQDTISGEQAVSFFSDSRLPEDTLAQIWDLADINSEGRLDRDEFAVAMYLIRQQRAPNAAPLPAFLPPLLVPPNRRKQATLPQQMPATQAFDNISSPPMPPKSAADDLFGLDEPSPPIAQNTAGSIVQNQTGSVSSPTPAPAVNRDPFAIGRPLSPASPPRASATQQSSGMFKPFMPTSAFGASLTQQSTGGSVTSGQAPAARGFPLTSAPAPTANDDLLGDDEAHLKESSQLTSDATELANMSNQIGNLRTQMEQTQSKRSIAQADLTAASSQKRDLEVRLQQFRAQYEKELSTVKELEQQLSTSRDAVKKTSELAMIEGTHQDLQSQHRTLAEALRSDQQENLDLKTRVAQVSAEVTALKSEIEKLKLDARQQKGLVSINKKQLATSEGERTKLQDEKAVLERESIDQQEASRSIVPAELTPVMAAASSALPSPSGAAGSTNPFARKLGNDSIAERTQSPPISSAGAAPTPSAFDDLFGPSSAFSPSGQVQAGTSTPPATSFIGRTIPPHSSGLSDSVQSVSTAGEPSPSVITPLSDKSKETYPANDLAQVPPPPPESKQFTAAELPIVSIGHRSHDSEVRSTTVAPPASRAGDVELQRDLRSATPLASGGTHLNAAAADEPVPGAFPASPGPASASLPVSSLNDDFDSAFASFGGSQASMAARDAHTDPFAATSGSADVTTGRGFSTEFPPVRSLEIDDDDDDDSDDDDDDGERVGFEDDFSGPVMGTQASGDTNAVDVPASAGMQPVEAPPKADSQASPPSYQESHSTSHGGSGNSTDTNHLPPGFHGLLPSREDPVGAVQPLNEAIPTTVIADKAISSGPLSTSGSQPSLEPAFPLPPPSRTNTVEVFHDASSRPISTTGDTPTNADVVAHRAPQAFDEFDEFSDLAEAQEADKSGINDLDFGLDKSETSEFNPAFDSPAASMTNTMVSSQQTPVAATRMLAPADHSAPDGRQLFMSTNGVSTGSTGDQPPKADHDWDAIFSGLDSAKPLEGSSSSDPWASATVDATSKPVQLATDSVLPKAASPFGGAITPGTEHDDPILKRLTGMGYPRKDALQALELHDYDINRAVDHLSKN